MRINRRTSGGRGEYEISGSEANLTPKALQGRRIALDLGHGIAFDTLTHLSQQGGKPRVRRIEGCEIHLHLQVAAALLMPHPVRQDKALGGGAPVLQRNRYAIEQIDLAEVRPIDPDQVQITILGLIVRNNSYLSEEIRLAERMEQVRNIWENAGKFPDPIMKHLQEHQALVSAGTALPERAEKVVYDIEAELAELSSDLGVSYSSHTDVIPPLLQSLGSILLEPPLKIDDIDPEQLEIRQRTIREWRQWASHRGAESSRFRKQVREAYNATCFFCGLHFPATAFNKNPGVDAAHILPWADFDLDHISNGICACKLHHWAFDEGLLSIVHEYGNYYIRVPETVNDSLTDSLFSIEALKIHVGRVPLSRLPKEKSKWPDPRFLSELQKIMAA
jgi:putative restriction endonuclease